MGGIVAAPILLLAKIGVLLARMDVSSSGDACVVIGIIVYLAVTHTAKNWLLKALLALDHILRNVLMKSVTTQLALKVMKRFAVKQNSCCGSNLRNRMWLIHQHQTPNTNAEQKVQEKEKSQIIQIDNSRPYWCIRLKLRGRRGCGRIRCAPEDRVLPAPEAELAAAEAAPPSPPLFPRPSG